MNWTDQNLSLLPRSNGFRMRGESMSRLEVFSDAAFAFALTMLVVSVGSIPSNYDELLSALKSVPAFAVSFAHITAFWLAHRSWSRRFGLEDRLSTALTLTMVFVILVYIYPLRLIFSSFFAFVTNEWLPSEFMVNDITEMTGLLVIYGLGYATLTGVIAMLFRTAWSARDDLRLDAIEQLRTKDGIRLWGVQCVLGLVSACLAWLLPAEIGIYAGFVYFVLGIFVPWMSIRSGRRILSLEKGVKPVGETG